MNYGLVTLVIVTPANKISLIMIFEIELKSK